MNNKDFSINGRGTRGGSIFWLMGPTSSGKTSIGNAFAKVLRESGVPVIQFDGDEVRDFFGKNHGFLPEDRLRVVKTLVHLANKVRKAGVNVVVSALTANLDARKLVEDSLENHFIVYIKCPIGVCIQRDPKGLYERAKKGEIASLIGFNTEYVAPEHPDLILDTSQVAVNESVDELKLFYDQLN